MSTQTREAVEALIDGHAPTDIGNADRLVAKADGQIRWVDTWNTWIVYDTSQGRWIMDSNKARVTEFAKRVVTEIISAENVSKAAALPPGKPGKPGESPAQMAIMGLVAQARKSSTAMRLDAMTKLARGIDGIIIDHEELDALPFLFNAENGTVDLKTGELLAHNPEHLLTLQGEVRYDKNARSDFWDACLARWQPDPEVRRYLQRVCGSAMTGHPVEALFINVGNGSNGKSKFFEALSAVLGPYKVEPNKHLLTVNRHEGHATEIATLKGARMAIAAETSDLDKLDESQVKNLTGGDTLRARRMREDEWSFKPTHTLFLHTNHRPDIKGTDEGIWRRVRLIPWSVTIPVEERDEHLLDKLTTPECKSAILNWLIEGCLEWRRIGTAEPDSIRLATNMYRQDEDAFGRFVETRCVLDKKAFASTYEITKAFGEFAGEEHEMSHKEVAKRLRALGCKPKSNGSMRGWIGIEIRHLDGSDGSSGSPLRTTPVRDQPEQVSEVSESPGESTFRIDDLLSNPAFLARYWAVRNGEITNDDE